MRNETRLAYNAYVKAIADLNGVPDANTKFTVSPSVQQKLESRIQQSSAFLQRINMIGVDPQSGEKVGLGIGQPIASTTDTSKQDRAPIDPTSLDSNGYVCTQTNFDTAIRYSRLDAWAHLPDFQTRIRDAIVQRTALDRMGDAGDAYALVDGSGTIYGAYVIESLNETATYHTPAGIAKKIEFNLTLKRVTDETLAATQGDGSESGNAAKELLNDVRQVVKVATTVVDNVKNLSINSIKSAAIGVIGNMAPQAAAAAVKGLSTATGLELDAAIKAARQVSTMNGDSIGSVVQFVLGKVSGDA